MAVTLWHNPRCSKSRQALALLEEADAAVEVRLYLKDAPTAEEVMAVKAALGVDLIDMMRTGEKVFKELGFSKETDEATLLAAIFDAPILIERPIAIKDAKAVIGRPPELVLGLL